MKIELIGKTEGVFKVRLDTDEPGMFDLYSESYQAIRANRHYIPEIIEMLQTADKLLPKE
jgi:hypothetical protein